MCVCFSSNTTKSDSTPGTQIFKAPPSLIKGCDFREHPSQGRPAGTSQAVSLHSRSFPPRPATSSPAPSHTHQGQSDIPSPVFLELRDLPSCSNQWVTRTRGWFLLPSIPQTYVQDKCFQEASLKSFQETEQRLGFLQLHQRSNAPPPRHFHFSHPNILGMCSMYYLHMYIHIGCA